MYTSENIKRRNPIGSSTTRDQSAQQPQDDQHHSSSQNRASDPYGQNPLKPAFQQQQHQQAGGGGGGYGHRDHYQFGYAPQRKEYSANKYIRFYQENDYVLIPALLTLVSFWTRFRDIKSSDIVVWDEAHFGKFGSYYIKGEFYFDVHPPLGKMLVGLSGALAGYDGSFGFDSGAKYPDIGFGFMRIFNAFFGAIMVPLAYWTSQELRMSQTACVFAAVLVLFDNAYLTISRFILLDSMLLSATCFVFFCLTRFRNERYDPFSLDWWLWLAMTGVAIGLVSSIKWVGLFVTALVGLNTIEELWDLFGDLSIPKTTYIKHWVARAACLIALPFSVYVASFALHFAILRNSGPGDAQMSSLFQAGLNGNDFRSNPLYVAYGSKVSIKNTGYGGGLLHSHVQTFPEGSGQQQVTCYHHKDNNNNWIIKHVKSAEAPEDTGSPLILRDGNLVRLGHEQTNRSLHSHRIKGPVTSSQWEVSGYGDDSTNDANDEWIIEIVDENSHHPKDGQLRSLSTTFRLRHRILGCLLTAENVNLPQWGFRQIEVTCDTRNRTNSPHSIWNVEQHWNDKLPAGEGNLYKSKFWKDFWHLNVAMMTSNNALIPDPDKEDVLASNPSQWPLLAVGLRMCGWGDDTIKFYLLGNPIAWWGGTLSLGVFALTVAYYIVRRQRKFQDVSPMEWEHFVAAGKLLVGGWFLHYVPFCVMGRVTYLHHYFPALYFSLLLFSLVIDHFVNRPRVSSKVRNAVWAIAFAAVTFTFFFFWDVSYGIRGPAAETMTSRQWRGAWNIIDDHKPNTFI
ncbi:Protein O-mannosyltransferase 2 [Mortierella hygrophila]|uniref:Dolichyl-phosphate-mannose--protein mannosyltransferase n=1 Tax=Mortierella hygrophila TaxID=979708 RepID=A0A9P6F4D7_9FUNG|nr:Protein O-mannosyltransferase 2 [Mortierella hygrophila]